MSHVVTVKIYDLGVNVLADISGISLEKTYTRQINGVDSFVVKCPASSSLLTGIATDGLPNLSTGCRKLVVWEGPDDGTAPDPSTDTPIFHGRIYTIERDGDADKTEVTVTAYDAWMELGYEADERAGRPVRDGTHTTVGDPSFLTPEFDSSVGGQSGVSGPDLIQQILTYSQGDPTTDPVQGEGPLPIDVTSGAWALDVPPELDLNPADSADWPVLIGDFIVQLVNTDAVDFDLKPVRPGTGINLNGDADDFIMVEATSKGRLGTDRTATVHFDYFTGSKNAVACKQVEDFSTYADRLWYELGPKLDRENWRGDITPHSASVSDALTPADDAAALYGGPGAKPGRFASFRILDSLGTENASRPLYIALYEDEIRLRIKPRLLLYITPSPDSAALFDPPHDFDAYDLVQIKTGAEFGVELDEAQRVYGYTKTWSTEGVGTVSQLVTSADVTLGSFSGDS